jgi:hypothetical protein
MMRKNLLGRTGLQISEIAFGAGVTGGILIKGDETDAVRALKQALAIGINWIDTAALYGDGASEATIGRHIHALDPQPYVSTKVRIERDQMHDIPGAIERSLEQSLKRLNLDQVALFQLHNQLGEAVGDRPTLSVAQVLAAGGVADTFDRLKEQGLFLASGITAAGDTNDVSVTVDSGAFRLRPCITNALNLSAGWLRAHQNWRAQDSPASSPLAAFHQHMGVLNIRIFASRPAGEATRLARLAVLTLGSTDVANEVRCAAAVRDALGEDLSDRLGADARQLRTRQPRPRDPRYRRSAIYTIL